MEMEINCKEGRVNMGQERCKHSEEAHTETSEKGKRDFQTCLFNDPSLVLYVPPPFFSLFLFLLPLSFCQISSAGLSWGWSLAFRLHYSPKTKPPTISFLCLSLTLVCLLPSRGPNSSLRPLISSPHLLFFLCLLPTSIDRTHASALCPPHP